jgi:Disulfide bond isomerase protein N-terminus
MQSEEPIAQARTVAHLDSSTPGCAQFVRRLDRPGGGYYLVVLGRRGASVAVVALEADAGRVLSWAALPGTGEHLPVAQDDAIARAHLDGPADAELVWKISAASRSPLYPLWEVRAGGRILYVDQSGKTWDRLEAPGHGG